ncbi:MAG TPA: cation transporter [Pyrinomonadaceae bacterium]|jgi:cation diffusion facilitator family transporter
MMSANFADFELPPDKEDALKRAERLEWWSLILLLTVIVAVGFTMGMSQAMKAMWVEDLVSLIPSAAFLVGAHYRSKPSDEQFPYGYRRAILIAFLAGSVALFGFGLYILGDSVYKLVVAEHPTIQTTELFGRRVWLGWLMVAALAYSVVPPFVLGRMKLPLARELHDKALQTSATINKGDWLAGLAGIAGIVGIAYGYWWADSVAAGFISFEIVKDGFSSLGNSVAQLMNKRPSDVESKEKDPTVDKVRQELERLDWVSEARVRLREDGDVLTGEAFIVPSDERDLLKRLEQATEVIHAVDWRLHDVNVVPVGSTGEQEREKAGAAGA